MMVVSWINRARSAQCYDFGVSANDFNAARPFSKSPPTILSMSMNRQNALEIKLFSPVMAHVTAVALNGNDPEKCDRDYRQTD
jgi:hypothetical protein